MQTFLPHPSFAHSVAVLDRARLGKQRIECQQILVALRPNAGLPSGWTSHPAVRMWAGHESALAVYMTLCAREWVARGYNQSIVLPYREDWSVAPGWPTGLRSDGREALAPAWLGDERLHASHRAALLQKEPEHYAPLGWTEEPRLEYWWPRCD